MIKILHLYYDLLNLYGEQGNILALVDSFNNQNVNVNVDYKTINDDIDFNEYDLVYMGAGSYENLLLALNDIKKYKKDIKKFIDDKKYFIATGSSYLMLGDKIDDLDGLKIFDYYAKTSDKRLVCHSFLKYEDKIVVGFQNKRFIVDNPSNHLFEVISGYGDNLKSLNEGFIYRNFYGTHLIGPLLIRNPFITDNIVKDIINKNNLIFHEDENTPLYLAYNEYIKNFYNN